MKAIPLATLSLVVLGCRPSSHDVPAPPPSPAPPASAVVVEAAVQCRPVARSRPRPLPLAGAGAGGIVALARGDRGSVAYIADEDESAIHTIDIEAKERVASTPLRGKPGQILVAPDGRVIVALRDRSALEVLDPGEDSRSPLSHLCLVDAPAEPVGLAATPDGATLLVASRWGHAITAYAMEDERRSFSLDLPRDPYAVVTSADGKKAFISHVAGAKVSVVDLDRAADKARSVDVRPVDFLPHFIRMLPPPPTLAKKTAMKPSADRHARAGSQAFALARTASGKVLMPEVLVETGPAGGRAGGYGDSSSSPVVVGEISLIDAAAESIHTTPLHGGFGPHDCLLPRAAAMDDKSGRLFVTCLGIDAVVAYAADKASPHDNELKRWKVAAGPTGIAVDGDARRAITWSQFDSAVSVISIDSKDPRADPIRISIARATPRDAKIDLGRTLFHSAGGLRIAADGRACANCHPDGRDDAFTWSTPEGPRQTPMLLGRLEGTAPFGWTGEGQDLPSHFTRTIQRLSGMGLTGDQRDAIFAYVMSLAPPVPPAEDPPRADTAVARGDTLFHDKETGCSSCHLGDDVSTDHASHDVKSATTFDDTPKFDTPSLRFIGRTAPYFHDGRYPTLLALIKGVDGTMGHTKHLSEGQMEDLSAYLNTL